MQPDTLTLTFRVTTAYITHTCSTVQSPHAHATRTYLSSLFLSFFTVSIRLSIYHARASFFTLSLLIPVSLLVSCKPSHCDYLFRLVSKCGLISVLLPFCPAFLCKGRSAVHPSSCRPRSGLLRPKKLKVDGRPTRALALKIVYFLFLFFLSLSDLSGVCARCGKSLSFEITFLFFLFSSHHSITSCCDNLRQSRL